MPDLNTMDRAALEDLAGDYDIDPTGMDDDALRAAIVAAENEIDTSEEDEFEAGMAEELAAREAAKRRAEGFDLDETQLPMAAKSQPQAALQVHHTALPKSGLDGKCPHCGAGMAGGRYVTEYHELSPGSQRDTNQLYTCNECAGEWGPVVDKPKKARAPSGSSNGLKIEADRPERNGVKRPSAGGKCRGIWDMLDEIGPDASAKQARDTGIPMGFDKTTIMVQYYRWRKFNGVAGRQ